VVARLPPALPVRPAPPVRTLSAAFSAAYSLVAGLPLSIPVRPVRTLSAAYSVVARLPLAIPVRPAPAAQPPKQRVQPLP